MSSAEAMARAASRSREATATTLHEGLFIMAGTTFSRPILAVLRMPQRTGSTDPSPLLAARASGGARRLRQALPQRAGGIFLEGRRPVQRRGDGDRLPGRR